MQKRKLSRAVLAVACSLCAANAMAIAPGLYLGLMMGPGSNDGSQQPMQVLPAPTAALPNALTWPSNPKSTQFGSRIFMGYKFNTYAGFEWGFSYFSGISYKLQSPSPGMTPAAGTTARVRSIDLLGKLDYSYNDTIGIFGKLGVAAIYSTTPGALNITNYPTNTPAGQPIKNTGSNTYRTKLSPTFSIGASYDFNQSWQMDFSWTRLFIGSSISTMNLYALGLSYHFVDVYCGQFLCAS